MILNVRDAGELAAVRSRIAALPGPRLLVARYLPGRELIVSAFRHPHFGPVLMLGSGGRLVDLQSDTRFVALPAGRARITRALEETLAGRALRQGFRGATGFEAALDLILRVAALAVAAGDRLVQIELNPVTAGPHGAAAVDAYVVLAPDEPDQSRLPTA